MLWARPEEEKKEREGMTERGWIKEQEGSVINPLSLTNRVQFPIRPWLNEKKWEGTEEKLKCPKLERAEGEREREREREDTTLIQ